MSLIQQKFKDVESELLSIADDPDYDLVSIHHTARWCAIAMREAAQGHARYEALRILTPRTFTELWIRCIAGEQFDAMADELVKAKNEP